MTPMPRNRSATTATPRKSLVLRLNQIRCAECHASARVKYLRPFIAYQTEDGIIVLCRTCGGVQPERSAKLNEAPAAATQAPDPALASPLRAA